MIMGREKKPKLKRRADGRFRVKYHDRYFYGATPEEAIEQRNDYIADEQAGITRRVTISGYAIPWLKRSFPNVADSTYTGLAIHIQHLVDEIGDKRISSVIPSDIKGVYSNQYKSVSNSYLKSAKQLYCSLFDSAVADGLCRSNPARDRTSKPHKGSQPKTRPITSTERKWIDTLCTDHRAHPVVMAMLYAGLRPQEAKAIDIDRDVDFANDTITVRQTAHNDGQKYAITGEGKTGWSNRTIPLFPPLKQALQGKHGHLIASAHGEQVTHTTWRVAWNSYKTKMETAVNGIDRRWYGRTKAQKQLEKLPEWTSFDIVPYDLRHSFCVMCRDSGVEMNTCRKWMGHADAKMILKVYDSVSHDRSENERKKIENLWIGGQNGGQNSEQGSAMLEK